MMGEMRRSQAPEGYFSPGPLLEKSKPGGSLCALCKGSKRLCGKDRCPLMLKFYSSAKTSRLINSLDILGSSPPGVFVGRYGYPKVDIGPLIPPEMGDTTILDTPEMWMGRSIDDIIDFRFKLVRGKHRIHVSDFHPSDRIVDYTRELAMAENPLDVEANFLRRPRGRIVMDDEVEPFGPSGRLRDLVIGNPKWNQKIEKSYYDTDLRATEAVVGLFKEGVMVSKIQKAFSVGAFGVEKNRKFVPTRWSITAVDDILGRSLLSRTKAYPLIDEFRVYDWDQLDNRWCVILMPTPWRYELIEAWYPNTAWNPSGRQIEMISSHEHFDGRTTYAEIGGCYYAARLAVNELLEREKRQAGAVILREAHPGYILPVGVWNVRENVRAALRQKPLEMETLDQVMAHVGRRMDIPISRWMRNSAILRDYKQQRRIDDYA